jgi:hypothetical protein
VVVPSAQNPDPVTTVPQPDGTSQGPTTDVDPWVPDAISTPDGGTGGAPPDTDCTDCVPVADTP